jgi:hypothetical protein
LTVSAGMRWSAQTLTGASGATAQTFPHEWQPRFGINWQLDRKSMHRVFGSYGRFYQQIPMNLSRFFYVDFYSKYASYSEDPRSGNVAPDWVFEATDYEADVIAESVLIQHIEVENFDEFTAGYEALLAGTRLTARGILRDLRTSFQFGLDYESEYLWVMGTPGKGDLAFLPSPKRTYTGLELSATGTWQRFQYRASYVLSRNWGNYSGLHWSDGAVANPGGNATFWSVAQAVNSEGLLPNDHTHVLKLTGAYRTAFGLTPGVFVSWMSGTPLNEWGSALEGTTFVVPRGTVGRTPSIWDLNVRLAYALPWRRAGTSRVVLDFLHLGNPQQTVRVDQQHYYAQDADGNPTNANANYLAPIAYQPPMTARIGLEVTF